MTAQHRNRSTVGGTAVSARRPGAPVQRRRTVARTRRLATTRPAGTTWLAPAIARSSELIAPAYYPAFLDLRGKRIVIVGAGQVASGKLRALLACRPREIIVIAPSASALVRACAKSGGLTWLARGYRTGDVAGADIVFVATSDRALNATIAREARSEGALVQTVDDPAHCDFIAPAIVQRGDLTIAISTAGRSPALARWLRWRLERAMPASLGVLLDAAAAVRRRLAGQGLRSRGDAWLAALDRAFEQLATTDDVDAAAQVLQHCLSPDLAERDAGLAGTGDVHREQPLTSQHQARKDRTHGELPLD